MLFWTIIRDLLFSSLQRRRSRFRCKKEEEGFDWFGSYLITLKRWIRSTNQLRNEVSSKLWNEIKDLFFCCGLLIFFCFRVFCCSRLFLMVRFFIVPIYFTRSLYLLHADSFILLISDHCTLGMNWISGQKCSHNQCNNFLIVNIYFFIN